MFMRQNSGKIVTSIHFLSQLLLQNTELKHEPRIVNIISEKSRINVLHKNWGLSTFNQVEFNLAMSSYWL